MSAEGVVAPDDFPVVGVGASAGGLEAFQQFLSAVPPDGGIAYVLIQHSDPNYRSHLPELLAKWTEMPITHLEDGQVLRPDRIYLAPPGSLVKLNGNRARFVAFDEPRGQRRPIDSFFQSLADAERQNCACIVLSGTGSDGAAGLRAVRSAGGLTLVQEPETAKYDGMPQAAAATGTADHVVKIDQMPGLLRRFFGHALHGEPEADDALGDYVDAVTAVLKDRLGHDFSGYKRNTVTRRIARRLQVTGVESHEAYVDLLRDDMQECERLFRELLINVTEFFRDREAFGTLREKAIRTIVQRKTEDESIRIWVPGCSSGEEPYTIAMLLLEEMRAAALRCSVQIFATDIDERTLRIGREAVYPDVVATKMPDEFLARYMIPQEGSYVVSNQVRDLVVFSAHNVLSDPPFSRLDLISCRNTLIYLQPKLQEKVFPSFAYGLRPNGFLFLGPSEGVSLQKEIFEPVSMPARLFTKRSDAPSSPSALELGFHRSDGQRRRLSPPAEQKFSERPATVVARLLDRYVPPHVVVGRHGRIEYTSGRLGKYLDFTAGPPTNRLAELVRAELRGPLRALLQECQGDGRRRIRRNLTVQSEAGEQTIDLAVDILKTGTALVVFQDVEDFRARTEDDVVEGVPSEEGADHSMMLALEEELEGMREQLRNTVEELETSNEELKSSNEEMMSMNEELQSTNEELTTVNDELKVKVDELAAANSDLQNLLEATDVATIFLDNELRIRTFTPPAAEVFRLKKHDRGRSLSDLAPRLADVDLDAIAGEVLDAVEGVEREVESLDGSRKFILRGSPYRTVDSSVDGVVLTLVEVTTLKGVQSRLEAANNRYQAAARASGQILYDWEPESGEISYLGAIEPVTGYQPNELKGGLPRFLELVAPHDRDAVRRKMIEASTERAPLRMDFRLRRKDGSHATVESRGNFFEVGEGRPARMVGFLIDNSHRAELEEIRRHLMGELQHRVKNILATVQSIVRQTAKNQKDKDAFEAVLRDRLAALSRTHDVVSQTGWSRTRLDHILKREIEPYVEGRRDALTLDGPAVLLPPRHALALTLAVHELTTNAVKHGALSGDGGRVDVSWSLRPEDGGSVVALDWTERDGPTVTEPEHRGFGRNLLERGLAHDLNGTVKLDFDRDGLKARIEFRFPESSKDAKHDH